MNIYGPPTCTFDAFAAHLASHPAPAINEAQRIWDELRNAGVDPAVALGFFHHESSCGLRGRAVVTKSWGNIRWIRRVDGSEPYALLPYSVGNVNGFCSYATYRDGARHFVDHLLGRDGTNNYAGLRTVEEVVPIWAPVGDRNTPGMYIAAVNAFAAKIAAESNRGTAVKVLIVQGHVNIQNITNDGACPGRDFTSLRGGTGSPGEAAWVGDVAQRLGVELAALGVAVTVTDAIYNAAVYGQNYDLAIVLHYHRDGRGSPDAQRPRAHAAVPAVGYINEAARAIGQRWVDVFNAEYEPATGIPVTLGRTTDNMTDNYVWCYMGANTPAVLPECGNADLDAPILFEPEVRRVVRALRNVTTKALGITIPTPAPGPRPPSPQPTPVPLPSVKESLLTVAQQLKEIAERL